MDKTFEDIIGEVAGEFNEQPNDESINNSESTPELENEQTEIEEPDTGLEEQESENVDEVEESEDLETEDTPSTNEKDVQAFARMRTELKERDDKLAAMQAKIEFFDTRAKQMGLDGVDGLIERTKEAELTKKAEEQGIPVDVLKRIEGLESKVNTYESEKEAAQKLQKEQALNHTLDLFVQKHSLAQSDVDNLVQGLITDGIDYETLANMPASVVTKILGSYLPAENVKQEMLAKKEKAKKEVPVTGNISSKINVDDEIDKIAKSWNSF